MTEPASDRGRLLRRASLRPGTFSGDLFGRPAPLALEIGFGDGRFLAELAAARPDWNVLGVEVSLASVSRAFRRLRREGVDNARLFRGDARFLVRDVLGRGSLDAVYVNFPDPWPRRRHAENRLLTADFLRIVADRLVPGGSVNLTTDHDDYFDFACSEADATGLYHVKTAEPPVEALRTKYARKWQAEKRSIHHAAMELAATPDTVASTLTLEPMQHALMDGDLAAVTSFEKLVRRFEGGTAVVVAGFRSLDDAGLLFQVVVQEQDLRQELLVKAWPKDDGVYVGLEAFGDPLGTRGAREAVRAAIDLLTRAGLRVREEWL